MAEELINVGELDWTREYNLEKEHSNILLKQYKEAKHEEFKRRNSQLQTAEDIWKELAPDGEKNSFTTHPKVINEKTAIEKGLRVAEIVQRKFVNSYRSMEYCRIWEEKEPQQKLKMHTASGNATKGRAAYFYAAGMQRESEDRIRMIDRAERTDAPWLITLRRAQVRMEWIEVHQEEISNQQIIDRRQKYYNEAVALFETLRSGKTKKIASKSIKKLEKWYKAWSSIPEARRAREAQNPPGGIWDKIKGKTGLVILAIILLSFVSIAVDAVQDSMYVTTVASDGVETKAEYDVSEDGYLQGIYNINHSKLTVPSEVKGKKIIGIRELSFSYKEGVELEELVLPEGLEIIDNQTLWNPGNQPSKLKKVVLPKSLKYIGSLAFNSQSSLEEIVVPENIQIDFVGTEAFQKTKWYSIQEMNTGYVVLGNVLLAADSLREDVTIPEGITTIAENVFYENDKVTELYLPDGLQYINQYAFSGCEKLISVSFPEGMKEIGVGAFMRCGNLTDIIFRGSVERIGDSAFEWCNYTYIEFPEGLQEIGNRAFYGTAQMTSVMIPGTVKRIGDMAFHVSAFKGAKEMERLEIKEGVEWIGGGAFEGIFADELILPDSLKDVGGNAFDCKNSMRNEDGFYIEDNVLLGYDGEDTNIVIPEGVTLIAGNAFKESEITSIVCPESLLSISSGAFYGCRQLKKVSLSNCLRYIGTESFANCALGYIHIPDSLVDLGDRAFYGCGNLTIVEGGEHLSYIGEEAFTGTGLTEDELKIWDGKYKDTEE